MNDSGKGFWSEMLSVLLSGGVFITSVVFYFKGEYLQAIYFILLTIAAMLYQFIDNKQL